MRISDWSSDVCSSDLLFAAALLLLHIGDVVDAEQQEVLLRQLVVADLLVHCCPSTSCSGRPPSMAGPMPLAASAVLILMVRTSGSTTWRWRSTWSRSEESRVGRECGSTCRYGC